MILSLERIDRLLSAVTQIQALMVAVATGGPRIDDKESEYQELYRRIHREVLDYASNGLRVKHTNSFLSLWDWYGYWADKLPSYAERRKYVRQQYLGLTNALTSLLHRLAGIQVPTHEEIYDLLQNELKAAPTVAHPEYRIGLEELHPTIRHRCRTAFEAAEYDSAIHRAMVAVEEALRERCELAPTDIGLSLITKALKSGPRALQVSEIEAEQQGAHQLFRGAIATFKNPLSHRFLDTDDPVRAFELLGLASLLLSLIDDAKTVELG